MKQYESTHSAKKRSHHGKKLLVLLLVVTMFTTLLPTVALAANQTASNQAELQSAITNVSDGETITIGGHFNITSTVLIPDTKTESFTIDLNGYTISGGIAMLIKNDGTGTLTITDGTSRSMIEATGNDGNAIGNYGTGTVKVLGGTVSSDTGNAIGNYGTGIVEVLGGTVSSATGNAILNTGTVNVSGGTVSSVTGNAILNTGTVNVSGGTVSSIGSSGNAIKNDNGTLKLTGACIVNGFTQAINGRAPTIDNGLAIQASENFDGTSLTSYNESDLAKYKYIKVSILPSIKTQPISQSFTEGQTVTFTVAAIGTSPLSYQWQKTTDGINWLSISGATSATYTISAVALADNGSKYRCYVSDAVGNVISNAAILTVTAAVPTSVPQTGDKSMLLLWMGIALTAIIGLGTVTVFNHKKQKTK